MQTLAPVDLFECPKPDDRDQGAFLIYRSEQDFVSASADFELPSNNSELSPERNINIAGAGEAPYVSLSGWPGTGTDNTVGASFDAGLGWQGDPNPNDGADQSGWFLTTTRFNAGNAAGTPSNRIYRLRTFDSNGQIIPNASVKVRVRVEVDQNGHIKVVATALGTSKWVNPFNPNDVKTELTLGVPYNDNGTPNDKSDDTGDEGLSEFNDENGNPVILPEQTVNGLNANGTDNRISLQILLGTPDFTLPTNGTYVYGIQASNFQVNDAVWYPEMGSKVLCKDVYFPVWDGNLLTVDIKVLLSCSPATPTITLSQIQVGPLPQCVSSLPSGGGICGSASVAEPTTASLLSTASSGRYRITLTTPYTDSHRIFTDNPNLFSFGKDLTMNGLPFTVSAVDTVTGATQVFQGIGRDYEYDTAIHFDFDNPQSSDGLVIPNVPPVTIRLNSNTDAVLQGLANYRFRGTAGQRVNVAVAHSDASKVVFMRVLAPDGTNVINGGNITFDGSADFSENYGETGVFTLPQTGFYTLQLQGSTASPLNYRLGLAIIEDPIAITSTSYVKSRSLTILGDHQLFSLDASLAPALSFRLSHSSTSTLSAMAKFYETTYNFNLDNYTNNELFATTLSKRLVNFGHVMNATAGQYIIEVRDSHAGRFNKNNYTPTQQERQGSYALRVSPVIAKPLTINVLVNAKVSGIVAYTFEAQAGQTFSIIAEDPYDYETPEGYADNFHYEIRDPSHQLVELRFFDPSANIPPKFTASASGVYTVYIVKFIPDTTASYKLKVTQVIP